MEEKTYITEISEFKGNPVFVIKKSPDDRYPFSFGLGKAKLIIDNIDAIREFVKAHESKEAKKE